MSDQSGHPLPHRRPTVFGITVNTNERRWLHDCFSSLLADRSEGMALTTILVDNASTDGSIELVAEHFPSVRIIRNLRNEGFAAANNIAMRVALDQGADYILLVNPDTRISSDALRRLVEFMEEQPEYGVIGPMQYEYTSDGRPTERLNEWSKNALGIGEAHVYAATWSDYPSHVGPPDGRAPETLEHAYVQAAALLCRAEVLRAIGLFDTTYHTYYEETDLCRRARWAGWRVALLKNVGIQHYGGGNTRHSSYRRRMLLRNKYYFLFTDPLWTWWRALRLALRWVRLDLTSRGAPPAETVLGASRDLLLGFLWLATKTTRISRRRGELRLLVQDGADGPLRPRRG